VQIWFQNYRAQVKRQASLAKPHSLVPAAIAKKPTAAPLDEELFARMTTDLRQVRVWRLGFACVGDVSELALDGSQRLFEIDVFRL
jgi:hypothetical protein